ncbi:hypothetical protein [Nocardia farcinica]|uniref:hypothetical protein n=1 Tax=Nocardia farcinica TaxID=37329 RepID=UPI001894420F|nr:hypothetical protein [Nocardia farcinica]MBF6270373.1 hypothetical protein [Nocardia farcinica]MCZ9326633.1 hypothetical protein [Nocardia farcinica]
MGVWIPGDGPERLAGHVAELDAAVHAVHGTACSPDGSVDREVDIYGAITRLQLTDFAMERGPQRGTAAEGSGSHRQQPGGRDPVESRRRTDRVQQLCRARPERHPAGCGDSDAEGELTMRVPTVLLAAALALAAVCGTACGSMGTEPPACPSETFDLHRHPATLGDEKALVRAFDEAAEQQLESTTMAEMTSRAGWSTAWDRVIYLGPRTTDEQLKLKAASDLDLACFSNLPALTSNSDQPSPHTTVFLADGKPVQAVWWVDRNPSLDFGDREFLLPDTVLRYDPTAQTMRAE